MSTIKLPGLIDPHVHLRTPGQTHKEDFLTGTSAALAGGYTTIIDMPNNTVPVTTEKRLNEKIEIAKKDIVCDVGFHFGSLGDNLDEFIKVEEKTIGLKLYLNETTGNFLIDRKKIETIFTNWGGGVILLHAEDDAIAFVIDVVKRTGKPAHFCHISTKNDLSQIIAAKEEGLPISCGVTPHHLFLTEEDAILLGPFGKMKPTLRSNKDVSYLWEHLADIDCIESDHAPHTIAEKESNPPSGSDQIGAGGPPYGVPGLETTLPLLLSAVSEKKLTIEDIIRLCHDGPRDIFGIKTDENTYSEIDIDTSYIINNQSLQTKCKWSPFDGWKMKGKIRRVFLRGKKVFEDGKILAKRGSGHVISGHS